MPVSKAWKQRRQDSDGSDAGKGKAHSRFPGVRSCSQHTTSNKTYHEDSENALSSLSGATYRVQQFSADGKRTAIIERPYVHPAQPMQAKPTIRAVRAEGAKQAENRRLGTSDAAGGYPSVRGAYDELGPDRFYQVHGSTYRNPHEPASLAPARARDDICCTPFSLIAVPLPILAAFRRAQAAIKLACRCAPTNNSHVSRHFHRVSSHIQRLGCLRALSAHFRALPSQVLNTALSLALSEWDDGGLLRPALRRVLDLACGSGEATIGFARWHAQRRREAAARAVDDAGKCTGNRAANRAANCAGTGTGESAGSCVEKDTARAAGECAVACTADAGALSTCVASKRGGAREIASETGEEMSEGESLRAYACIEAAVHASAVDACTDACIDACIDACDPHTFAAFEQRVGRPAERWSFEQAR
eukprot:2669020-Pleurochrysis_carterae.AAC.3